MSNKHKQDSNKNMTISVRFTNQDIEDIYEYCNEYDCSVSSFIRSAIKDELDKFFKKRWRRIKNYIKERRHV